MASKEGGVAAVTAVVDVDVDVTDAMVAVDVAVVPTGAMAAVAMIRMSPATLCAFAAWRVDIRPLSATNPRDNVRHVPNMVITMRASARMALVVRFGIR